MKKKKNNPVIDAISFIMTLISIFIIMGILYSVYADDYWLYIRTYNKYDGSEGGQSQRGDIVEILPVCGQYMPTETEKQEWAIIKVSGMDETDRDKYRQPWTEYEGSGDDYASGIGFVTKSYRKYTFDDLDILNIEKGLNGGTRIFDVIRSRIKEKTQTDLDSWEAGRSAYLLREKLFDLLFGWERKAYALSSNISTINKTGEDYNTLTLWEDAVDGNLVSDDRQETAECYDDDGVLDDDVIIDGSITDSSHYLEITVPEGERHGGTVGGTQGFTITPTRALSTNAAIIDIKDNYSVVEWVRITGWIGQIYAHTSGIKVLSALNCIIRNNIVHDDGTASLSTYYGINDISFYPASPTAIYNNIVIDIHNYGINCVSSPDVYNNTVYGVGTTGIRGDDGAALLKNNIVTDCGTNYGLDSGVSWDAGSDYNLSESATATGGANDETNVDSADLFVNETADAENLHLKSEADGSHEGVDLAGIFAGDIDGDTRSDWDKGADEYQSAEPTMTPTITPGTTLPPILEEIRATRFAPYEEGRGFRFFPYEEPPCLRRFGDYEEITIRTYRR